MRLLLTTILSIFIITMNAQVAMPHNGAPTRINHTWQDVTLSEVLRTISQESQDYHIHYIHEQLDSILVNAKIQNMTVPNAIAKVYVDNYDGTAYYYYYEYPSDYDY